MPWGCFHGKLSLPQRMVFSQPKITCGGLTFPGNPVGLGRVKRSLIAAGILLLAGSCAWAQVQRADNASRTAATVQRVDAATTTANDGLSFNSPSEVDTDLGEQLPVSMVRGGLGATWWPIRDSFTPPTRRWRMAGDAGTCISSHAAGRGFIRISSTGCTSTRM